MRTGTQPVRVLLFSTLYPNAAQPNHGVFVENRLRHVVETGAVEARVVAPIPWFPSQNPRFGRYADFAAAPDRETRHGIEVLHPRYPVIPKVGMTVAPALLYAASRARIAKLLATGFDFDLIDAHYFYPDGVAAAMLGQAFGKPVAVTARGSDINLIARHALPRRMIRWTARRANAAIAVSQGLKDAMIDIGVEPAAIAVLRNGVDLVQFAPVDGAAFREERGLTPPILLSVGNLVPLKGHHLTIRSLVDIPHAMLLIAGTGPEEAHLHRLAAELGVGARVRFLGRVPHERLCAVYSAADVLVHASAREGWPNVLLESLACGTPVAATNVGAAADIIDVSAAGRLIPERTPQAIAGTVNALLADPPAPAATRAYAETFSWDETTRAQIEIFGQISKKAPAPHRPLGAKASFRS